MPAFEYKAVDGLGRRQRGVHEADSQRQSRQLLRDQGLTPLETLEVRRTPAGGKRLGQRLGAVRISISDLALFTRQLATLLHAGTPLDEALANIGRHQRKAALRRVVSAIRSRVVEGFSLARALGDHRQIFDELFRATVEAGEEAGRLDQVLERLADHVEARQATEQKVRAAMIYPMVLTLVALGVLGGLLVYVVPGVVDVFANMQKELPPLTRLLLDLSAFLQAWWWLLLLGLIAGALAWRRALRAETSRMRIDRLALQLPLIGNLYRGIGASRFARTLSILAGSGVPILSALEIAGRVVNCLPMKQAVGLTRARVQEGRPMWKSLEESQVFPPMMVYLIANGETSGQLERQLERAASGQERETESALGTLLALFEPALILVMGGLVLVIVLAILLPIFELNQMIGA